MGSNRPALSGLSLQMRRRPRDIGRNRPCPVLPPIAPGFATFMSADKVSPMTKIVIVDDHEALREGLAALLANQGLEILGAAGNVAAGLDLVEHSAPDVAIVDIKLPD